ncbi:hypothetical protein T484DRAFT_1859628 [Baffinella frigidus]|nr:hypothetical protein T484DRAFT_1859628 [Cryptophyta sp. CCMP2293]
MSSAKPADSTALASSALQGRLRPAHVIQIDERSMVSAKLLGHVDHQCRVACSPDESFGAVPVVLLYGVDLYWTSFRDCVALKKMARFVTAPCTACSAEFHPPEADCDFLPNLLHRMRFSACTRRDLEWVNHLTLDAISARDPARRALFDGDSTLYLVPKKSQAHDINSSRFERLQQASGRWGCGIRARDGTDAGRAGAGRPASGDDEFGGLPARTWLTPGALVVVTTNLAQDWRVFNGTVVDIIFAEGSTPSVDGAPEDWPLLVLVDLPGYTGPAYFPDRPSVVPISPVKRHEKGRWREMFPLKLGWALTFHKAQGMTIGLEQSYRRVVVDLGEESVEEWGAGLAFVGLSRPKTAASNGLAHL